MIEQLTVCQHNVARGREIQQSFFEISLQEEASLILVHEPYTFLNPHTHIHAPVTHPAYHAILPSTVPSLRPRVIAYVSRLFPYEVTPRYEIVTDSDIQILEIFAPIESFYIIHIYNERSLSPSENRNTLQRL